MKIKSENKMSKYKKYGKGWFNESHRHSLARQGIKTRKKYDIEKDFFLKGEHSVEPRIRNGKEGNVFRAVSDMLTPLPEVEYSRELRDELEVPGYVNMYEMKSKSQISKELNSIIDKWEKQGYKKPNDVPECEEKQRFRELLKSLGLKVSF